MQLVSVYSIPIETAANALWALLEARPPEANISHKEMPSWGMHLAHIALRPYTAWFLIDVAIPGGEPIYGGAIYLTEKNEIGIALLPPWQGRGIATEAVKELRRRFPRKRYFANVAPANLASQQFWLKQGAKPLQVTYELAS